MPFPSIVQAFIYMLSSRGVGLEKHIDKTQNTPQQQGIIAYWWSNPAGFKFVPSNMWDLAAEMLRSGRFGADCGVGFIAQQVSDSPFNPTQSKISVSLRETSQPFAFHLVGFMGGWWSSSLQRNLDYCNLHLDSVSPVLGLDAKKCVVYDVEQTMKHILKDLFH